MPSVRIGIGIGLPGGGAAPFVGLLDSYPNAAAAYSLRKLRLAYAGSCIRVRRSSDNAEQDIGFVANVLDTASLLTFTGANNGFVTTWYDQSGSGLNLTQTTAAKQPQIVSSGVVITGSGSKPALDFGTTRWFTGGNIVNVTKWSKFNVFNSVDVTQVQELSMKGVGGSYFANGMIIVSSKVRATFSPSVGTEVTAFSTLTLVNNTWYLGSMRYDKVNLTAYTNGANSASTAETRDMPTTTQPFTVGVLGDLNSFNMRGKMQEDLTWPDQSDGNHTGINANINSFYAIY